MADVLNDPTYRDAAVWRLRDEYARIFSPTGFSNEAASHYHGVNYLGWTEAMYALQQRGLTAEATAISQILTNAANISAHFISPTGDALMIGNSRGDDAFLRPGGNPSRPVSITDTDAGVAFGRWSWTDQSTTAWSAMNRRIKGAHGHNDRLSVTWQTGGTPILIDPGQPDYDTARPLTAWSKSAEAHNTSIASETKKDRAKETSLAVQREGAIDEISMSSTHSGFQQTREVQIDNQHRSMWVSDVAQSSQEQHWHFAPGWAVDRIEANVAYLTDAQGRTLSMTVTPGSTITPLVGSSEPIGGWIATGFQKVDPALELVVSGGEQLDALFVMGNGTPPEDVKILRTTEPLSRKIQLAWSAPTEVEPVTPVEPVTAKKGKKGKKKARREARKLARERAEAAPPKIKGYRIQMKPGSDPWKTIVSDTGSDETTFKVPGLDNGTAYRFRVAALAKATQTVYSSSRKFVPFTSPGPVTLTLAVGKGPVATQMPAAKGKKAAKKQKPPKVKLGWLEPTRDGGAPVTGYEVLLPPEEPKKSKKAKKANPQEPVVPTWEPVTGLSTVVPMLKKKMTVLLRAVNKRGGGKEVKVLLKRKKDGTILANGKVLVPVPPPTEPTPTPTPVVPPVDPADPAAPDPAAGAPPVDAAG
jgi:hypothetical protein